MSGRRFVKVLTKRQQNRKKMKILEKCRLKREKEEVDSERMKKDYRKER